MTTSESIAAVAAIQTAIVATAYASRLSPRASATFVVGGRRWPPDLHPLAWLAIGAAVIGGVFAVFANTWAAQHNAEIALAVTVPASSLFGLAMTHRGPVAWAWAAGVPLLVVAAIPSQDDTLERLAVIVLVGTAAVVIGGLARLGPAAAVQAGIVVIAAWDTYLVATEEIQEVSAITRASAPPSLPQLYEVHVGTFTTGNADLLVGGLTGVALRAAGRSPRAALAGALAGVFAVSILGGVLLDRDVVETFPATTPFGAAVLAHAAVRHARRLTSARRS